MFSSFGRKKMFLWLVFPKMISMSRSGHFKPKNFFGSNWKFQIFFRLWAISFLSLSKTFPSGLANSILRAHRNTLRKKWQYHIKVINFFVFWAEKFWHDCQNCILRVQRNILALNCFLKNVTFMLIFQTAEKKVLKLGKWIFFCNSDYDEN